VSQDAWYRRTAWNENDERQFFMQLGNERGAAKSAQILRIQAYTLARSRDERRLRAALGLLAVLFNRFPDPGELASARLLAAQCHDQLGELEPALKEFRLALDAQVAVPGFDPGVAVEFGWFVASRKLVQLYDEALRAMASVHPDTPLAAFKLAAVRAFVAESEGKADVAAQQARAALAAAAKKASRFRTRGNQGLVGPEFEPVVAQLRLLAGP
jgi:hypothetical protein